MTNLRNAALSGVLFGLVAGGCDTEEAMDGAALGKQVCECTGKANAMDGSDPDRSAAHERCGELQSSTWNAVKGTAQQDPYNAQFPCGL